MLYFALIGLSVIIIGLRVTITGVVRLLILFSRQHKNIIDRGFEPMNPFTGLSLESSCFNHLHKRIDWSMDTDEVNTDYTMNLSNSCTYDNIQIGSDSPFAGK